MVDIQRLIDLHESCLFCQNVKSPTIGSSFNILDLNECILTDFSACEEPKLTFNSVMDSPDREKWIQAMDKEMETLQEKGCWDIAIIPTRRRINLVRSFFVYKVKKDQNGNCIKWKARLVAKGSSQIHGVDFWKTYSPVARLATLRTLLAVAAIEGMITHQLDISLAYINADLQEEIFMSPPPNFNIPAAIVFI